MIIVVQTTCLNSYNNFTLLDFLLFFIVVLAFRVWYDLSRYHILLCRHPLHLLFLLLHPKHLHHLFLHLYNHFHLQLHLHRPLCMFILLILSFSLRLLLHAHPHLFRPLHLRIMISLQVCLHHHNYLLLYEFIIIVSLVSIYSTLLSSSTFPYSLYPKLKEKEPINNKYNTSIYNLLWKVRLTRRLYRL